VGKIRREQNKVAHCLAQFGLRSPTTKVTFSDVPFCIQGLVCNERFDYRLLLPGLNKVEVSSSTKKKMLA
jgi:hypothetical protein